MESKLNQNTLVLNRSWTAVHICSVRNALTLVSKGHAKVVDEDLHVYDWRDWSDVSQEMLYTTSDFIHSPSIRIKIPRVIVLLFYDKLPERQVSFTRRNLFERDNFTCQYCGTKPPNRKVATKWMEKKTLNLDHVVPKSRGGKTTWENVVASCVKCNSKKGDKLLKELGWKLRKNPVKPKWQPTLQIPMKVKPHKTWVNFLDLTYWNAELENENQEM